MNPSRLICSMIGCNPALKKLFSFPFQLLMTGLHRKFADDPRRGYLRVEPHPAQCRQFREIIEYGEDQACRCIDEEIEHMVSNRTTVIGLIDHSGLRSHTQPCVQPRGRSYAVPTEQIRGIGQLVRVLYQKT